MALPGQDQIVTAQKANADAFFAFANTLFEGVEKLAALNLQAAKSNLAEAQGNALKAVECSANPQEWVALQAALVAPLTEKVMAYGRHVFDIASATQGSLAQIAEAQYERHNGRFQAFVEEAGKSAPAGSEAAIAAWKSAIGTTSTLYDTLQKASKQAMQVTESNLEALTTAASKAARRSAEQAAAGTAKR
ncbi:TIGR01841 family phasin [Paraburkholderia kururiensis]|uniref:TIGR01841 family phasin n=1 Tax=Paraburkholderia kururiensis TaxID=984307 RepID=UPI0005A9BDF8|nr:TIGR01841 family phasin [Paraburkholderia kururiensis]